MSIKSKQERTKTESKPPVAKLRAGLVTASIWERETEAHGKFYAVTFERRYRDSDGQWQSSHSYDAQDLLTLAKLADLAHTKILEAQDDE